MGELSPLVEVERTDPETVVERAERNLAGYGPLAPLLDDASSAHRKLDASEGLQDAQLDDGARLSIVFAGPPGSGKTTMRSPGTLPTLAHRGSRPVGVTA